MRNYIRSVNGLVVAPGEVRLQAITWASVEPDLCHHVASLGHSELMYSTTKQSHIENVFS